MKVNTMSVDLAKSVFQVIGFSSNQNIIFNKRLSRAKFQQFMHNSPCCRVVMEACYSSNYWGRLLTSYGHSVELIPSQHVTPFVRGNKNDSNDALAIFEASNRLNIRKVPIKSEAQQEILMLHKLRERWMKMKTSIVNQARGLLSNFGIVMPLGAKSFEQGLNVVIHDDNQRPLIKALAAEMLLEYKHTVQRIALSNQLMTEYRIDSLDEQILQSIPGIGPIIASAFSSSIDKGQAFKHSKDFAVWLGLTPKQVASGNKSIMLGISKRGNNYLRKQLIHGARSIVKHAVVNQDKDALRGWIYQLRTRKSFNCTVVATARKLAQLIWLLLQKQEQYKGHCINTHFKNLS